MQVNCATCGTEFSRKASHAKRMKRQFCSPECLQNAPNTKADVRCQQCGNITKKFQSQIKQSDKHFCSHKCSELWHSGEKHHHWKGGKGISKEGYVYKWTGKSRGVIEHRDIFEKHIGRPLTKDESVHHKNGDRTDNRFENLELWDKTHPAGQRVEDKIKWAKEFLESHGYLVLGEFPDYKVLECKDKLPPIFIKGETGEILTMQ